MTVWWLAGLLTAAGIAWWVYQAVRYGPSSRAYQGDVWRALHKIPVVGREKIGLALIPIEKLLAKDHLFVAPNPHKSSTSVLAGLLSMRSSGEALLRNIRLGDGRNEAEFNAAYNNFYRLRAQLLKYCEMNRGS